MGFVFELREFAGPDGDRCVLSGGEVYGSADDAMEAGCEARYMHQRVGMELYVDVRDAGEVPGAEAGL